MIEALAPDPTAAAAFPAAEAIPAPLSIVILIDSLDVGGAQRLIDLQVRAMAKGHHHIRVVNLAGASALSATLRDSGVEVVDLGQARLRDVAAFLRLRGLLLQWRPDIIHAHLIHATLAGALLKSLTGAALVVTLHSEEANRGSLVAQIKNGLERIALRQVADRVIACGPQVARWQGERLGERAIDIIPNRIPPASPLAPDQREALRGGLGCGPQDLICLAAGRLTRQKGFDILVRAFGRLAPGHPAAKLIVAGDGEDRAALADLVRATGTSSSVRWLGARSDVARLMACADIFVLSSRWEGLPLVLLEAMTAGLPIVATEVGDVATVAGGNAALLVPPGDDAALAEALSKLLDRADLRADLGAAARRRVRPFTDVSGFLDELMRVYGLAHPAGGR